MLVFLEIHIEFEFMKTKIKIILITLILLTSFCREKQNSNIQIKEIDQNAPEEVKKTLDIFDQFFNNLKNELVKAIQEKGYSGAISVCKIKSPELENTFSAANNKKIYRISDKYRNPKHKPTDDEYQVLQYWIKKLNENQPIKPVYYQIGDKTKVLKPIKIIGDMCLKCHGDYSQIDPDVKEILKKEYPEDKAIGYKLNDLRGAFVAEFGF